MTIKKKHIAGITLCSLAAGLIAISATKSTVKRTLAVNFKADDLNLEDISENE